MGNRTNFNFIDGTAARSFDYNREETLTVCYNRAPRHQKKPSKRLLSEETRRNLKGAECTFTKAQYLLGTLVCFGGGLLMIMLERMF